MRRTSIQYLLALLFLFPLGETAMAQGNFNPDNPPEPRVLNRIQVVSSPEDAGYVSGAGQYETGTVISIRTSLKSTDYTFLHWLKDGVVYSQSMNFNYTVEDGNKVFTAVYEFNPANPAEPTLQAKRHIYLNSNLEDACSFNRASGEKADVGASVYLRAYANQGFVFQGWYQGDVKLSGSNPFYYTLPDNDVTLTAHFEFDPDSPGDPQGSQSDVDNPDFLLGDVNHDGKVSIGDVAVLVQILKRGEFDEAGDMDGNNVITTADVNALTDLILER